MIVEAVGNRAQINLIQNRAVGKTVGSVFYHSLSIALSIALLMAGYP